MGLLSGFRNLVSRKKSAEGVRASQAVRFKTKEEAMVECRGLKDVTIIPLDHEGYGLCDRRGLLTSKRLKDLRKIESVGAGFPGLDLSSRLGDILKGMRSDYGSKTLAVVDRANAQNFVAAGANWEKSGNVWDGRGFYSVRSQPFKAENSNFFHKVGYCVDKTFSNIAKPLDVFSNFVFETPVNVYSTFKKSLGSVRAKFTAGVNFLGGRFKSLYTQEARSLYQEKDETLMQFSSRLSQDDRVLGAPVLVNDNGDYFLKFYVRENGISVLRMVKVKSEYGDELYEKLVAPDLSPSEVEQNGLEESTNPKWISFDDQEGDGLDSAMSETTISEEDSKPEDPDKSYYDRILLHALGEI